MLGDSLVRPGSQRESEGKMGKSRTEEGLGAMLRGWFYLREPVLSKRA